MGGLGSDAVSVVCQPGSDFYYSSIKLYILLSSYLCFISFYILIGMYNVLGDNTSITWGYLMRTKHLFIVQLNMLKLSSKKY